MVLLCSLGWSRTPYMGHAGLGFAAIWYCSQVLGLQVCTSMIDSWSLFCWAFSPLYGLCEVFILLSWFLLLTLILVCVWMRVTHVKVRGHLCGIGSLCRFKGLNKLRSPYLRGNVLCPPSDLSGSYFCLLFLLCAHKHAWLFTWGPHVCTENSDWASSPSSRISLLLSMGNVFVETWTYQTVCASSSDSDLLKPCCGVFWCVYLWACLGVRPCLTCRMCLRGSTEQLMSLLRLMLLDFKFYLFIYLCYMKTTGYFILLITLSSFYVKFLRIRVLSTLNLFFSLICFYFLCMCVFICTYVGVPCASLVPSEASGSPGTGGELPWECWA